MRNKTQMVSFTSVIDHSQLFPAVGIRERPFELKRKVANARLNMNHHLLSSQTRRRETCISFRAKIRKEREMRLVFSQELTMTGTIRDLLFSGKGRRMVGYRGLLISWFAFSFLGPLH